MICFLDHTEDNGISFGVWRCLHDVLLQDIFGGDSYENSPYHILSTQRPLISFTDCTVIENEFMDNIVNVVHYYCKIVMLLLIISIITNITSLLMPRVLQKLP